MFKLFEHVKMTTEHVCRVVKMEVSTVLTLEMCSENHDIK